MEWRGPFNSCFEHHTQRAWNIAVSSVRDGQLHCIVQTVSVSSVTQSVWLCDPMDYGMPGFPVHHQLMEFRPHLNVFLRLVNWFRIWVIFVTFNESFCSESYFSCPVYHENDQNLKLNTFLRPGFSRSVRLTRAG